MNIWNIVSHLSTIVASVKTVEGVVQNCVKEKRAPAKFEIKSIVVSVQNLYDAGVFPLPLDKAQVDEGFKAIEDALS